MSAGDDLAAQIDELRRQVETLKAAVAGQRSAALQQLAPASYLGQTVPIVVTVTDPASLSPVVDVPVTVFTTWGVLRGDGDVDEGTSFTAQTGSDGSVRLSLLPGITLDDIEDQDALQTMLAQLDPAAATPAEAFATLQKLAQQYRWEANRGFRSAVDAYFRDLGQRVIHAGEFQDYMGSWPLIPVALIAYVDGADPSSSATAATITLKVRNWLGPWLQVYRQVASSSIQLDPGLQFVKANADTPDGFVTGVYDHVGLTVENEFGELGKKVAQQAAQKAIGTFLDTGISDLPLDMRVAVSPALATGARSLASAGANVVSVIGQNHVTATGAAVSVAGKVDKTEFQTAIVAKANTADLQNLLAAKADVTTVHDLQGAIATKANAADLQIVQAAVATKANLTDLQTVQAAVATKANAADLQTVQAAVATKANLTDLQTVQAAVATKADAAAFQVFQKATNTAIAAKLDAASFDTFSKQVNDKLQLTVTKADLDGLRTSLQGSINAKADKAALDAVQTQTNTVLATKADTTALANTTNRIGVLENKVR